MEPVCLVHVGDLHLHPGSRQPDRLESLDQIVVENESRPDLGGWLAPGDLYHKTSTIEDRRALVARLRVMADSAPVFIVDGNHDAPGDLAILTEIRGRYPIWVWSAPAIVPVTLATGQTAKVLALPYPSGVGYLAAGATKADLAQLARPDLDNLFMTAGVEFERARALGEVPILIGHFNVAGSISSVGQPQIGKEIELDAGLLARLGPCVIALNHIHRAQGYFAGSVCRLDWGEIEPKSYRRVYWDGEAATAERRPLDVPPMYHVECWMTHEGIKDLEVKAGPEGERLEAPASWARTDVRLRARYLQSEASILGAAAAEAKRYFAEARRFEFEPVCVPDRGLRAPQVAAARTLAEKVRAWSEVSGVPAPEEIAACVQLLDRPEPSEAVAEVKQRLEALVTFPVETAVWR